ncbi:MAG TPA: acyltransferase [Candidatus Acidoferrum sp.]
MRPRYLPNPERLEVGSNCFVGRFTTLFALSEYEDQRFDSKIVIGNDVYIGSWSQLHAMGLIALGDGCVLSDYVYISDTAHGMDPRKGLIMKQPLFSKGPVIIGEHTFMGHGSAILPGVTLGKHCVVGARSVVTKSFPNYSVIAGNPARQIKSIEPEIERALNAAERR